jgi:hypothetical protein
MTLPLTAAFLLLATVPQETFVRDSVACIEINAFHDDEARLVFTQAIFYDADDSCRDWRLVRNRSDAPQANIEVHRDYLRGDYVARWLDGETFREVRAATYRETFTQYDRELIERDKRPTCERKLLAKPGRWKP